MKLLYEASSDRKVLGDCPKSVTNLLSKEKIENIQFFKARLLHRACIWDKHAYPESYSYLAQFWALPSMPYGYSQDITVSSGIFEPKNLQAINQEIGENNLVEKKIHFDGKHPLYKNVH